MDSFANLADEPACPGPAPLLRALLGWTANHLTLGNDTDIYAAPLMPNSLQTSSPVFTPNTSVTFYLNAGAASGGKPYQLAGAITGTWPGINLVPVPNPFGWGVVLPLTNGSGPADPVFLASLGWPGFAGTLDPACGTAQVTVQGRPPGTVPNDVLHFAFAVLETSNNWRFASNAVRMVVQ